MNITLYSLFHTVDWNSVHPYLIKYHPECKKNLDTYKHSYKEILTIPLVSNDELTLVFDRETNDYIQLFCIDKYNIKYNIYPNWEYWLSLYVDPSVIQTYTYPEIVSICLWEMTFYGFTNDKISKFMDKLSKLCNNSKSNTKWRTL